MNGLQEQFVAEARELIHLATGELIAAEREGFSAGRAERIFRAFHTLKGAAGVVELPAMGLTMHAAEDLLSAIVAGRAVSFVAVIDQLLTCLDQISTWVDQFEIDPAQLPRAGEDARKMVVALRNLLAPAESAAASRNAFADDVSGLPDWAEHLIDSHRRQKTATSGQEQALPQFALSYEPHAGCFFDGEDPLDLMRRLPQGFAFNIEPREAWPPLAELDPFTCNLRLQAISAATHTELTTLFRLMPDQVRIVEIPSDALPDDKAGLVQSIVEEQMRVLAAGEGRQDHVGRFGSVTLVAANALRHISRNDLADKIESVGATAVSQSNSKPLLTVIEEALSTLASRDVGESHARDNGMPVRARRSLRVDELKIDALLDLANELVIVKNGFAHLATRMDEEDGVHGVGRMISVQYDSMDRLVTELYSTILQLRMVPIANVFRSFPKLVRDIGRRLNKSVKLVTRGETTESDKTIVDLLFEPLMHLVRNAIDHGIETPEQRQDAGKPEIATVTLGASRRGDRFVVEVVDDGRGIDPAKVRRKAEEKQLLSTTELASLSDDQAIELIFSVGFSTASEVSDISGRGVGMDVVRSSIERIGGRVSVKSQLGAGTTISLDLPMNIAMSHIMLVEAGGQIFGIPMDAVSETVRLSPDQISRIKNNDGFVLRDRVVPICSLAELMNLPSRKSASTDARLVIVIEFGGRITAIEVDAIRDRMEVVLKPMQGLLSNTRGYAGTTLTGDGAVLLVLDMKEIMP